LNRKDVNFNNLEARLGVKFSNRDLLKMALTHPSAVNEIGIQRTESNQRLEFLGDAVLDLVVADQLYNKHQNWPEGKLTIESDKLINGATLAKIASEINLGECLILGKGAVAQDGRINQSILAAAFEAIVAAIFIDAGYDAAKEMIARLFDIYVNKLDNVTNNKKQLQELLQSKSESVPRYRTIDSVGDPHDLTFSVEVLIDDKVMGVGTGSRKIVAQQEAAKQALDALLNK